MRTRYTEIRTDLEPLREIWRQAGLRVLERAAALARELGIVVETALLEQDGQRVSRVIVDDATRWQADPVVGTHGRHGIEPLAGKRRRRGRADGPGSVLLVRAR